MAKSEFATVKAVQEAMHTKLKLSDLTPQDAKTLGMVPYTAEQTAKILPSAPAKAGFFIPYFNLSGKPTKFYRFRYLETVKDGFAKLTDKKDMRYVQPPKTLNELYLPPLLQGKTRWVDVAGDKSKPIFITEGELKAACACKYGFPTIGLGGVYCFTSIKAHVPLLAQFNDFEWEGRNVCIVYDSDAVANPLVISAENKLARELTKLGAMVSVARLPDLPGLKKTGLDDFLTAMGREGLLEVLGESSQWAQSEELHRLNEEVCVINNPGMILRMANNQPMSKSTFVGVIYADRQYTEYIATKAKDGKVSERAIVKFAAEEWMCWPHRNVAEKLTYRPGQPRRVDGDINTWLGWAVEPAKGDITPWIQLMDFLFKGMKPDHRQWLEQWFAWPLQHPGAKMFTGVVVWGIGQGTGKTLLGETMKVIYGQNYTPIEDEHLESAFNEWAINMQFALGDEITGNDSRALANKIKTLISRTQIRINTKGVPSYTMPDCINYYFTSNHPDAFFLDDGDRRLFIWEVKGAALPDEFYAKYDRWFKSTAGAAALFDYLLHVDLTGFNPMAAAPVTSSKKEMIDIGKSDLACWVAKLRDEPDSVLQLNGMPSTRKLWTTSELHDVVKMLNPKVTENGLARTMKAAGMVKLNDGDPIGTAGTPKYQRLWAIKDKEALAKLPIADIAHIYNVERGLVSARAHVNGKSKTTKTKF